MNRDSMKLLEQRTKLALGSLALVEKQLLDISTVVDNYLASFYTEDIRGQEENLDSKFFITPPLSVYDGEDDSGA